MADSILTAVNSFVVSGVESEGHCMFFDTREKLWKRFVGLPIFDKVLGSLWDLFVQERTKIEEQVSKKCLSNGEASIVFRNAWADAVHASGVAAQVAFSLGTADDDMDLLCIIASVQRYVFLFLCKDIPVNDSDDGAEGDDEDCDEADVAAQRESESGRGKGKGKGKAANRGGRSGQTRGRGGRKQLSFSAEEVSLPDQPDSGLQLIAGGSLGEMHGLLRKNKDKDKDYAAKKEILKCLTIPNEEKEAHTLPVEQTSRDRGYMYFIRPVFLPLLRNLDEKIRCEFGEGKHGEDLVTVIDSKINTDKDLLDELIETVRSSAELCGIEPDERVSKFLCQTFIRKYTHARIGGFIRGEYDAHVEAMGGRSKGGAGLRDKLYSVSGQGRGVRGRARGKNAGARSGRSCSRGHGRGESSSLQGRGSGTSGSGRGRGRGRGKRPRGLSARK